MLGGVCSEYYGLQKNSPTCGLYFFAEEYIRFLSNLEWYLSREMRMIDVSESKHSSDLIRKGQTDVPIGVLDDVEVIFLHYHDAQTALDKWNRRVKRINWDNLIIKFSYMNDCTDEHIHQFEQIVRKRNCKSFVFVSHEFKEYPNAIVIPARPDGQIGNDTFYWNRYINVEALINGEDFQN